MIIKKINKSGVLCYWDEYLNASKIKSTFEHVEQINLVAHCRQIYPEQFKLMLHVPNESDVPVQYRAKLNKCGILKGASDWLILVPANLRSYMVLELKRSRKRDSSISKDQVKFLLDAQSVGAFSCVAYGYKAALQAIDDYFSGKA